MFLSRSKIFIITNILNIVMPILLILGIFKFGTVNLISAIIYLLFVGNFIFLLFKAGYWEFTNYYIRYVLILVYLVIGTRNLFLVVSYKNTVINNNIYVLLLLSMISLIMLYLNLSTVFASRKPEQYIKLCFPFKNGKYIITDGGDGKTSSLINYHNKAQIHKNGGSNTSMRYATDIAKLSKFGFTVNSVLTRENKEYEIFHEKVYCPCDAIVVDIVDGMEDNIPFSGNYPYNVGNRVVLKKDNYYIVMGHLAKDSITVKPGDKVLEGQLLAIIGNAGLTPRPHLHMQVSYCEDGYYWKGKGVPIFFNDKYYPVKNTVIKV
ncbi:M23 family metallopeptidase [Clostridium manihotivorum]|uniref:M23ase beta-sheet core domain-containing protein n=1 Tax=Clostridium manihotivorum TaxID=2320868 RepID=A0A410DSE9_9CLOT|nr:M23 family metallopeptidase [Clostridium manihotivorum]QAA31968.1 hypothetical protein C1I91_10070 [Clostridium manihotivorum]